jgi:4-hydroxybenzoate polyprenyltransferase
MGKPVMEITTTNWIRSFEKLSRWQEYSTTKVPLLFTPMLYYLRLNKVQPLEDYLVIASAALFASMYLAFGYMVNDYSDRQVDRIARKENVIGDLPTPQAFLILAITVIAGLFALIKFQWNAPVIASLVLTYGMALAYSLPPIHFKVLGFWGLLVGGLSQRMLPLIVLMAALNWWSLAAFLFLGLYAIIGLRWMLIHQIIDEANDRKAGVQTYVTQNGSSRAAWLLYNLFFPLEVCLGSLLIVITAINFPILALLLVLYWGELLARYVLHQQGKVKFSLDQYGDIPLAVSYFLFWPACFAVLLAGQNLTLIGIVILVILWQWRYMSNEGVRLYRLVSLLWWQRRK